MPGQFICIVRRSGSSQTRSHHAGCTPITRWQSRWFGIFFLFLPFPVFLIFLEQLCNKSLPLHPADTCLEETYLICATTLSRYCWKEEGSVFKKARLFIPEVILNICGVLSFRPRDTLCHMKLN